MDFGMKPSHVLQEKVLAALKSNLAAEVQARLSVTSSSYPRGSLDALAADDFLCFESAYSPAWLEISGYEASDLVQVMESLWDNRHALDVFLAISNSWTWGDYIVEGLPAQVRMAKPRYTVSISPGKPQTEKTWQKLNGAEILTTRCESSDPRNQVPPFDWVRHCATAHSLFAEGSMSGSACNTQEGVEFEVYSTADVTRLKKAYGPVLGLPACEITTTTRGRANDRSYLVRIRLP
jgi:hypothetical protein